jgi:hypothetical protein
MAVVVILMIASRGLSIVRIGDPLDPDVVRRVPDESFHGQSFVSRS